MGKLIRDLGVRCDYMLSVSTSSAGVELTADSNADARGEIGRDDFSHTVVLATESRVLDLIRALGAACKEMRRMTGGPAFFERTDAEPHAVNRAVHDAELSAAVYNAGPTGWPEGRERAAKPRKAVEAEDEDLLRERAVMALFKLGRLHGAGSTYASDLGEKEAVSEMLAELVEYLGSQFVERRHEGDPAKRRGPLFDGWAPRPAAEPVANFPVQADAAARMEGDFVKEMHALAVKYRGTVIQDSVILEVAKIEETVAEQIAAWLDKQGVGYAQRSEVAGSSTERQSLGGAAAVLRDKAIEIRRGTWRGKKGG